MTAKPTLKINAKIAARMVMYLSRGRVDDDNNNGGTARCQDILRLSM